MATQTETHEEYIARMTVPLDIDESYAAVPPREEWFDALGIPAAPYFPDVLEARPR